MCGKKKVSSLYSLVERLKPLVVCSGCPGYQVHSHQLFFFLNWIIME
uniref:Uncharacterized protein n=1 Tax=Rhizophora mucronata TaxID=61149 RepID=A0A2P2KEB5_RHIMU